MWKFLVHQGQTNRILGRIHQRFEFVELAKYLKRAGKVLKGRAWVAVFHAPHRIDGGTDTFSQGLLRQMSAAPGHGNALPDPAHGAFNRKRDRTTLHNISPKLERIIEFDAPI